MVLRSWVATYCDTGERAENVGSHRYTPAHTYREAQVEADRSGRAVKVAAQGSPGRVFSPKAPVAG